MTEKLLIACLYSVVNNMSFFFFFFLVQQLLHGKSLIYMKRRVIKHQDSGVKLSISNSSFGFN